MAYGFVLIRTAPGREKSVIIKLLSKKVVREIHTVFGEYDIVALMTAKDYQGLGQKIIENVRSIEGVEDTMTLAGCKLKGMP
jgi:DNA-binding Lrp family transcriptional regulator